MYHFIKLLKSTTDQIAREQLSLSENEFNNLCKDKVYRKNLVVEIKDIEILTKKMNEWLASSL